MIILNLLILIPFLITSQMFAQSASDYYPLHVGDYWIQHTDSISGEYQPTTFRKDIEAIDLILGEEYSRIRQTRTADDGSSDSTWYSWVREASTGILLGGFGETTIVDSATIFDPPLLWLPNEIVNVGHVWEFNAPEMGGHFLFGVISITNTVEVPAGTFDDCIIVGGLIVDTAGDTTQLSNSRYAEGIGEVLNMVYIVSLEYYELKLTEYSVQLSVDDNNGASSPSHFHLQQNYPNPFNPSTTIRYGLENDSYVKVEIYDMSGKLISTLRNNDQTQGWHSVIWNGTNHQGEQVPTGLYFSKVTSNNDVKTIKLMLLK